MAVKSFIFKFADIEVREREFTLIKAGEVLPVEPKAFRVLLILLRNPQKLLPKDELLTAVWGETAVSENSLARSIALLRRLLGDEARTPRFIETVATVGYRWVCKVEACEEAGVEPNQPLAPPVSINLASINQEERTSTRKHLTAWLPLAAVLVLCLTGAAWYLHRPLPPPRISSYTQVTHDGRAKFLAGTDGSRLYFTQGSPETMVQIGATGGEVVPIPVTVPGDMAQLRAVSPDGSRLFVASDQGNPVRTLWDVSALEARSAGWTTRSTQPFPPTGAPLPFPLQGAKSGWSGAMGREATRWLRREARRITSHGRQTAAESNSNATTFCGRFRRGDRIFIKCFPAGTGRVRNAAAVGLPTGASSFSCLEVRPRPEASRFGPSTSGPGFCGSVPPPRFS